ncbi:GNAT family N-acetyltransferase [Pseudoalteromonas sp. OOF1S-7]|uniref:GNAT family N-acetyltransferase n=1 Tax=Pseudoalteromonas sp. OOF1S-7 TaxID=2917757 RepID=UPI001EF65927|nr:GNAT family N-acetyltransferase [Pseudoalteromonas sp. OOF1S-7]MCG7537391.1 GNAT family N-acetyltransferase [Pseudoalteromonas sp. OOF1S-7]
MEFEFREAKPEDSAIISTLVVALTTEICEKTKAQHFNIDLRETSQRCRKLIIDGKYSAIIGMHEHHPVAIATITETYALYAGGKIGVIQEFYVVPEFRKAGLGAKLLEQVNRYGKEHEWSCIELCTPPLPEFERTLKFYQKNGLIAVGGRKMRQVLA